MADPDRPPVTLVRVGGRSTRPGAWIATGTVIVGLIGIIAAGALGSDDATNLRPDPSGAAASPAATAGSPAPGPTGPTPDPVGTRVVAPADAGYEVDYPPEESRRPVIFDRGALAIFGYGERGPDGAYAGTIRVAVGTPARGAIVPGAGGQRLLYARTLEGLRSAFLADDPPERHSRTTYAIGGEPADIWDPRPGADGAPRSVALTVHGNRAFVIAATGFQRLLPGFRNPANAGLVRFLAGFRFTMPLYVNDELGFQVPQPVAEEPSEDTPGSVVFPAGDFIAAAGMFSHLISVAVGTADRPAPVQVLTGGGRPITERIWASSLVELQSTYLAAIGASAGSSTTIRLGGELAVLVERPNGLAATVLAVRRGRVVIVSTTGTWLRERAPGFVQFLNGFAFLDEEPVGPPPSSLAPTG